MPKQIDKMAQRKIIRDIAIGDHSKKTIAKKHNISYGTLYNIMHSNRELYEQMLKDLRNGIEIRSLICSDAAVKRIKKDKLEASTGLQLSQIAKNLTDITKTNDNSIQIQINQIPQSKDEMIKFILNTKDIEISDNNEIANLEQVNNNIDNGAVPKQDNDCIINNNSNI